MTTKKKSRIQKDRPWAFIAHTALAVMGVFVTCVPYFVIVHTSIEHVFFACGGVIVVLAGAAAYCAWKYETYKELLTIQVIVPALVIVLFFRIVNVFIASLDRVEIGTNVFLYFSIIFFELYRRRAILGFLAYDKKVREMNGEYR
jgi:uncharacterized membrane protein